MIMIMVWVSNSTAVVQPMMTSTGSNPWEKTSPNMVNRAHVENGYGGISLNPLSVLIPYLNSGIVEIGSRSLNMSKTLSLWRTAKASRTHAGKEQHMRKLTKMYIIKMGSQTTLLKKTTIR